MLLDSDETRVRHMLDAAQEAAQHCSAKTRGDLEGDRPLQCLLIRSLEVVGEAASRTSQTFREQHPDLPLRRMVGIRNRLIHAYFDIDMDVVWRTVTEELPGLIDQLHAIVAEEEA